MKEIRYTLLSEGTSDKALIPILNWLLKDRLPEYAIQSEWADLGRLPKPPKSFSERIERSIELYPCDLLFVHRDADNQGREQRVNEIKKAAKEVEEALSQVYLVCVIPIRMTEAWLLFSENAIRTAAENPRGRQALEIPDIKNIEDCSDPKHALHEILIKASGASGRRLKKFTARLSSKVQRISQVVQDFSPLKELEAFQDLEAEILQFIEFRSLKK